MDYDNFKELPRKASDYLLSDNALNFAKNSNMVVPKRSCFSDL